MGRWTDFSRSGGRVAISLLRVNMRNGSGAGMEEDLFYLILDLALAPIGMLES